MTTACIYLRISQDTDGTALGEYDRYNMRRLVSLTANIHGEDLGRVANQIDRALKEAGAPPRGMLVDVRGQVVPMRTMFRDLARGPRIGAGALDVAGLHVVGEAAQVGDDVLHAPLRATRHGAEQVAGR